MTDNPALSSVTVAIPRATGGYHPEPPGARPLAQRNDRPRHSGESRRLVVGREIAIHGSIQECDTLVVEGRVEADLTAATSLEIALTGTFKGSAEVDHADISGLFEGELTVHKTLKINRSGRVVGTIRYTLIEIEQGGLLQGQIDVMPREAPVISAPSA